MRVAVIGRSGRFFRFSWGIEFSELKTAGECGSGGQKQSSRERERRGWLLRWDGAARTGASGVVSVFRTPLSAEAIRERRLAVLCRRSGLEPQGTMRRDAAPTEGERCGGTPHLRRIPRCQRARGPGDWSSRSACVTVHRYLYQIGGRISIEVIEPLGGILGAAVVPTERFLLLPALLFCPLPERFVRFLC